MNYLCAQVRFLSGDLIFFKSPFQLLGTLIIVQSRPLFIPAALGIAGKKRVQYNLHAHVS